jgi:hypothetical protein
MTGLLFCLWLQAAAPAQEATRGSVQGVVLNALTKEPVRKAEVQLQPVGRNTRSPQQAPPAAFGVVTDAAGVFTAQALEPGEYYVSATKNGFLAGRYGAKGRSPGPAVQVAAGKGVTGIEILLTPQGVICGRVVDEDGDPLPHASVAVMQSRMVRGRRQIQRAQAAGTNDKGEFRISDLPAGKYLLAAEVMSRGPVLEPPGGAKGPETGYNVTFFPGVVDPGQAAPVEVQAGQELTGLEIMVRRGTVFRVRGKIVDATTGQPAERAYVFLIQKDERGGIAGSGRQWGAGRIMQGNFEITGVPSGSYLLISQQRDQNERLGGMLPVEVGNANVDGLTVVLQSGTTLQGRVVMEGAQLPAGKDVRVSLNPTDGYPGATPPNPEMKEDGSFALKSVLPGRYRVNAWGAALQNSYLAVIRYNDQDVTFQDLDLSAGAAGTLTLVFRGDGGSISGTVRDNDQPAGSGNVLILSVEEERRAQGGMRMVPVAGTGSFEAKNLRPGDYYAISMETVEPGIWDDPEWMKAHQSEMTKVTVSPGGSSSVQLKCVR